MAGFMAGGAAGLDPYLGIAGWITPCCFGITRSRGDRILIDSEVLQTGSQPFHVDFGQIYRGSRCIWGCCDFWVASNKLISGRQMTRDYSCCNAAWESLASLASLGWDHLLHGNHLRSRPLHSDGLRRDVRLRGDLGGSDFLALAPFVLWTQRKIDWNIGRCKSTIAIPLVFELTVTDEFSKKFKRPLNPPPHFRKIVFEKSPI